MEKVKANPPTPGLLYHYTWWQNGGPNSGVCKVLELDGDYVRFKPTCAKEKRILLRHVELVPVNKQP
jgi:hypothetical protein